MLGCKDAMCLKRKIVKMGQELIGYKKGSHF